MARKTATFVDEIQIRVVAGDGGHGCMSFASRAGGLKLGPDGGHGGWGGDVWLVASTRLNTLNKLGHKREYKAGKGQDGSSQKKTGAAGANLFIEVPCGTEIHFLEDGFDSTHRDPIQPRWLGSLDTHQEKMLVAKGGKRGLGNSAFVSSTEQRPQIALSGGEGETRVLKLTLKLLAHVGLAGFPNAGKSTLLRALSRATPKVASYPFTTLHPHLGVMKREEWDTGWIIADIPGLLEGAEKNKGLGFRFLSHLEKTQLLLAVIAFEKAEDILRKYHTLKTILSSFSHTLSEKKLILFISQVDRATITEEQEVRQQLKQYSIVFLMGSAHTKKGLERTQRVFT